MLETAASVGWKVKDAIVWFHGIGRLVRWARRKYKRLRERPKGTRDWLARVRRADPNLFAHWRLVNVGGRTSEAV